MQYAGKMPALSGFNLATGLSNWPGTAHHTERVSAIKPGRRYGLVVSDQPEVLLRPSLSTAWARVEVPSFLKMRCRWFFTVKALIFRIKPIS